MQFGDYIGGVKKKIKDSLDTSNEQEQKMSESMSDEAKEDYSHNLHNKQNEISMILLQVERLEEVHKELVAYKNISK